MGIPGKFFLIELDGTIFSNTKWTLLQKPYVETFVAIFLEIKVVTNYIAHYASENTRPPPIRGGGGFAWGTHLEQCEVQQSEVSVKYP